MGEGEPAVDSSGSSLGEDGVVLLEEGALRMLRTDMQRLVSIPPVGHPAAPQERSLAPDIPAAEDEKPPHVLREVRGQAQGLGGPLQPEHGGDVEELHDRQQPIDAHRLHERLGSSLEGDRNRGVDSTPRYMLPLSAVFTFPRFCHAPL